MRGAARLGREENQTEFPQHHISTAVSFKRPVAQLLHTALEENEQIPVGMSFPARTECVCRGCMPHTRAQEVRRKRLEQRNNSSDKRFRVSLCWEVVTFGALLFNTPCERAKAGN